MSMREVRGALGFFTLLRWSALSGLVFGLLGCIVTAVYYGSVLELGYYIAQPFFFAVMMCFVTCVVYLPYRALARRGRFGLDRITYSNNQ
jgi:hypothetical protein